MPTIYEFASWVLLAEAAEGDKPADAKEGAGGLFGGGCVTFLPFLLIGVLFYFMMIVPQRREQKKMRLMIAELKKNDRVVTAGGIFGTVVNAQKESPYVTIKVDESSNTKLKVMRTSISRVLTDGDADEKNGIKKDVKPGELE